MKLSSLPCIFINAIVSCKHSVNNGESSRFINRLWMIVLNMSKNLNQFNINFLKHQIK